MNERTKEQHLRHLIAKYAMRSGEEIKRGLPAIIREAHRTQCWKHGVKHDGTKFNSIVEWLLTNPPPGCGLGCTPDAITYDELMRAFETSDNNKDVAKIMAGERPKGINGRPKKSDVRTTVFKTGGRNACRSTISARLAQEYPKHYQGYLDGKYGSVRAAAEAAGLVPPGHDPLMRLKAYWKRATKRQKAAFVQWIEAQEDEKEEQAILGNGHRRTGGSNQRVRP